MASKTKTLRAACLEALQLHARLKAVDGLGYCTCVSCGRRAHYTRMDGGHYIAKGSSTRWALEECNVHPQCRNCNRYGIPSAAKIANEYEWFMRRMYGDEHVDEMHASAKHIHKLYESDLEDMYALWASDNEAMIRNLGKRAHDLGTGVGGFEGWWNTTGGGITPKDGHDMEEHARRVAKAAWEAAGGEDR